MARMLSLLASTIRGSVGGLTYFSNQFHQIVLRQRTAPVNPNTTRQSQIRGAWGDAQSLYEALSNDDKLAWDAYAQTLVYEGPLGNYTLPGRQVCLGNVATGLYLDDRGFSVGVPAASPPLAPGFLSLADLEVGPPGVVGDGFNVTFRNNNAEDITVYLQRSIAFNTGRKRFKGPWLTETLTESQVPSLGTGNVDFLGLNVGSAYFATIRAITDAPPYKMSRPYFVRAIAANTPI